MGKKVSVIVPCYNVEKCVDRCVESLVTQTIGVAALELILVDDASSDGTLQKLAQWEEKFPEDILVVSCEQNGRQGRARNIGMEYASAPYWCFVDADDWLEKDALQEMYQMAVSEQVEVVIGQMGRDTGSGFLPDEFSFVGECDSRQVVTVEQRKKFFECGIGACVGKLYRSDFLKKYKLHFLENTAYEDNYFCAQLIAFVSFYFAVPRKYYHYFANLSSTVTSRNSDKHLERLSVEIQTLDMLCELGLDNEYHDAIYGRFLKLYYLNTLHLIFQRFDVLPYTVLNEMRKEVLERFPEYKESQVYERLSSLQKGFLLTLEVEMTTQMWDNLAANYRYIIKENARKNIKK